LLQSLQTISGTEVLKEEGIILCEHSSKEHLPEDVGNLHFLKIRKYGSVSVTLYQKTKEGNI
jgi:16S rRNA G966 N2-methylase RsmD